MRVDDLDQIVSSFPAVTKEPHHDKDSYRVVGKIFATVTPDQSRVNVFVPNEYIDDAVEEGQGSVEELWWGKKLSGVKVTLKDADQAQVADLLHLAWTAKAPKRLIPG